MIGHVCMLVLSAILRNIFGNNYKCHVMLILSAISRNIFDNYWKCHVCMLVLSAILRNIFIMNGNIVFIHEVFKIKCPCGLTKHISLIKVKSYIYE